MMFGRKRKPAAAEAVKDEAVASEEEREADEVNGSDEPEDEPGTAASEDETGDDESGADDSDEDEPDGEDESDEDESDDDESDGDDSDDEDSDDDSDEDEGIDAVKPEQEDDTDWRADGPFDADEVDLDADQVERLDLGALVLTPFAGLQIQLQVNQETKQAGAVAAIWNQSGLELVLYAARAQTGMAEELRDETIDEARAAGGTAMVEDGPFGPQVRRVLSQDGPNGEQLVQVSRVWLVDGPRWTLRGTLLGQAAIGDVGNPDSAPFVEFFRNIVVRRGGKPMVPGEVIPFDVPAGAMDGGDAA